MKILISPQMAGEQYKWQEMFFRSLIMDKFNWLLWVFSFLTEPNKYKDTARDLKIMYYKPIQVIDRAWKALFPKRICQKCYIFLDKNNYGRKMFWVLLSKERLLLEILKTTYLNAEGYSDIERYEVLFWKSLFYWW